MDANVILGLEFIGVVAFALSGALAAVGRRLDVAVFCLVGLAAGLAGGTLRDLLISTPIAWIDQPAQLAACLVAVGVVWAVGERPWREPALLWADAVGLAATAAAAAAKAASVGVTPLGAGVIGLVAAAACSLARDALARAPPLMFRRELYLAAAGGGVLLFVVLRLLQVDAGLAAAAGALLAFALRAGGLRKGWALPGSGERD